MQEVIIYRNPAEAAMWQSYRENPEIILFFIVWIATFAVAFTVINYGTNALASRFCSVTTARKLKNGYLALALATGVSFFSVYAFIF